MNLGWAPKPNPELVSGIRNLSTNNDVLTRKHACSDPPRSLEVRPGSHCPTHMSVLSEQLETLVIQVSDADVSP